MEWRHGRKWGSGAAGAILLAALALLASPASAAGPPVLGIDWSVPGLRLAWFDPQSLRMLPGRKAPLGFHNGSWSFSADRSVLAIGGDGVKLRFVDARRMRVLGDLRLAPGGDWTSGVTWLASDRLLAYVGRPGATTVVSVDPSSRRVLHRRMIDGIVAGFARLPDGLALLLRPEDGIGPARVAVVDASGAVRTVTVGRISIGSPLQVEEGEVARTASAGFAVDPTSRTSWVVGADALAEVDLDNLAVTYRSSPRQLAKAVEGPYRTAAWLGGGLLAVSGADYRTTKTADGSFSTATTPYGLRLLDLAAGTSRTIDSQATTVDVANGLLLVRHGEDEIAYGRDGRVRFHVAVPTDDWLTAAGGTGLVCSQRNLVAIVDLANGARTKARPGSVCADLLRGRSGY
ncbi:MAG TPA: hypothetical protein VFI37_00175 [Gaiellaceae bacterium]|jgi:hypothetical protein|nr:hypothetical protein [Gaiellaceae bacterium]